MDREQQELEDEFNRIWDTGYPVQLLIQKLKELLGRK